MRLPTGARVCNILYLAYSGAPTDPCLAVVHWRHLSNGDGRGEGWIGPRGSDEFCRNNMVANGAPTGDGLGQPTAAVLAYMRSGVD